MRYAMFVLFSLKLSFYNELYTVRLLGPFWHRAGPVAEQSRAEPSRAEPSRADPSRAEPSRAEPSRAGPGRAEPGWAEPTLAEPSQAGPGPYLRSRCMFFPLFSTPPIRNAYFSDIFQNFPDFYYAYLLTLCRLCLHLRTPSL